MSSDIDVMFYISLASVLCGTISLAIKYCYKSKCREFSCFCFKIIRDTNTEKDEDLAKENGDSKETYRTFSSSV